MEISKTPPPAKAPRSLLGKVFDVLSGFGLATILLLLLAALTLFATLEQVEFGLYPTLNKYFATDWRHIFVLPELYFNGKYIPIPPMPGGYWLCALLLLNMTLGGIIRISKGWNHAGNLISHFGIVLMLVGGGVTYHFSERGNMAVDQGQQSNTAEDYFEYVVEVAEIKDGKPTDIHVIRGKQIDDLKDGKMRTFRLPDFPFDLQLAGYLGNTVPVSVNERAPASGVRPVDGYFLVEKPAKTPPEAAEQYTAGCYAKLIPKDDHEPVTFILAGASFAPFTWQEGDRVFTIDMRKRLWPMPFTVRLDKFTADFHPGTAMASKFVSNITRIENGGEAKVTIRMNEPMRYEGMTFFQASYGPPGAGPNQKLYSVFEVVKNPADKWPEYSLWIVAFGMLVTFMTKLVSFIAAGSRKKNHV